MTPFVRVIGAGLAGCEAALQLASFGHQVHLYEMKPHKKTPAQKLDGICELVCSNSFRSDKPQNAVGLLKDEMLALNGFLMRIALKAKVPAGDSLAVDRVLFSKLVERAILTDSNIQLMRKEVVSLPIDDIPTIVATGPLTGEALASDVSRFIGTEHLSFYDAIAPIVDSESVDMAHAYKKSRWQEEGEGDFINCPLDQETYGRFVAYLNNSMGTKKHAFEQEHYFEGCLPLEVMAKRGVDTLRFGPLKPVGLEDPRTGVRPHAVIQLRKEDRYGQSYNLVGCQTRMTISEQRDAFALIPALRNAVFMRFGSIHRNTYVNSPQVLDERLKIKNAQGSPSNIYLAGQLTGVEGYVESMAVGLLLSHILDDELLGKGFWPLPKESALGGLYGHVLGHHRHRPQDPFTPSNVTWAMLPPVEVKRRVGRMEKRKLLYERAMAAIAGYAKGREDRCAVALGHENQQALG